MIYNQWYAVLDTREVKKADPEEQHGFQKNSFSGETAKTRYAVLPINAATGEQVVLRNVC